jgi:hypothetical protein
MERIRFECSKCLWKSGVVWGKGTKQKRRKEKKNPALNLAKRIKNGPPAIDNEE